MAGRIPITPDELKRAIEHHCVATGQTFSEGEDRGVKRYLLSPSDIAVFLEEGFIKTNPISQKVFEDLGFFIAEERTINRRKEEDAQKNQPPNQNSQPKREGKSQKTNGQNLPAVPGQNKDDFSVEDWRKKQAKGYSVAGKMALSAFNVSEEANKRLLSTHIIDSGKNDKLAWGHVRVFDKLTGQEREDKVTHDKPTFSLLKAWDDANSANKRTPGIIIGINDNNMPVLDPDVKISGYPAPLWLSLQILRAWSFADRDALTKAERRAQLKMLNREWREPDEITLEDDEANAVAADINFKGGNR